MLVIPPLEYCSLNARPKNCIAAQKTYGLTISVVMADARLRYCALFVLAQMMELVELDRLRDAYVGVLGANGLSLEQRKRLTMAVELVANPSIVFMVRRRWELSTVLCSVRLPC